MAEGGIGTENVMAIDQVKKPLVVINKPEERSMPQQEVGVEKQRFNIPIVDTREQSFPKQTEALQRRLIEDKVDIALLQARQFFGKYAQQEAKDLAIKIIPGERIGSGQAIDKLIELETPTPEKLEEIRKQPHPDFGVLSAEQYNPLVTAVESSIVLHEGTHALLDSKPDSQFAADLEKVSGMQNQDGQIATLLDEGIAHGVQGLYAPYIEPVGSLAPCVNSTDSFMHQTRKTLGDSLRPLLSEYITQGKTLDAAFLTQAGDMLKQYDLQRYVGEYKKQYNPQKETVLDEPAHEKVSYGEEQLKTVFLRNAEVKDLKKVLDWDEQAKKASTGKGFSDSDRERRRDTIKNMIVAKERFSVQIISDAEKPIGMAIYDTQPVGIKISSQNPTVVSSEKPVDYSQIIDVLENKRGKRAHLTSTAIDPEFRGKGIGTVVNKQMEEVLKAQGVDAISFDTGVDNKRMQRAVKGYTHIEVDGDGGYGDRKIVAVKLLAHEETSTKGSRDIT